MVGDVAGCAQSALLPNGRQTIGEASLLFVRGNLVTLDGEFELWIGIFDIGLEGVTICTICKGIMGSNYWISPKLHFNFLRHHGEPVESERSDHVSEYIYRVSFPSK